MGDIIFDHVNKDYHMGEVTIHAAKQVSFHVKRGKICIILGPSGVGKTTVLNLLGDMEIAASGRILFGGKDITAIGDLELADYRRHKIGFVFQFYSLTPNLAAAEDVELAKQVCKSSLEPEEALRIVGLKDRVHNSPAQLSGGEQQHAAIARAICKNPDLLLYDEPIGTLDTETGKTALKILSDISRNTGEIVVVITHNSLVAPIADRLIEMKNGMAVKESVQGSPADLGGVKW